MGAVNADPGDRPDHLAYLLHTAIRRMRAEAEANAPDGVPRLQAAQARLLDLIPPQGGRATDLSQRLGVSKQGLGPLVTQLANRGYVEVTQDPGDRRARVIRRTPDGDRVRQQLRDLLAEVEDQWRRDVGSDRYATFRAVLAELAHRSPRHLTDIRKHSEVRRIEKAPTRPHQPPGGATSNRPGGELL